MAKASKKSPQVGHNSEQSDRDIWTEQQFLNGFRQIKEHEADMAGTRGEIGGIYKRLEKIGFAKEDIAWAKELEKKDSAKVLETMQRRIRIAKMLGHGLARQIDFFEKDRAPLEERAYDEGLAAGKLRKDATNPYGADSKAGQRWQTGFNDGTAFINKDLDAQFNTSDDGDELIAGDDPDDAPQEAAE